MIVSLSAVSIADFGIGHCVKLILVLDIDFGLAKKECWLKKNVDRSKMGRNL
jgi:hypothetical protein